MQIYACAIADGRRRVHRDVARGQGAAQPAAWQADRLPHFAPPARPPRQVHTLPRARTAPPPLPDAALCLFSARVHVHGLRAPRSFSARHALRLTLTTLLPALKGLCHAQPNKRKLLGAVVASAAA